MYDDDESAEYAIPRPQTQGIREAVAAGLHLPPEARAKQNKSTVDLCGVAHRVIDDGDQITFESGSARITFYVKLGGKWFFRLDPEFALVAVEVVVEAEKFIYSLREGR